MSRTSQIVTSVAVCLLLAGCSEAPPTEPAVSRSAAMVPGTGNPTIDAQLEDLYDQTVACATRGEMDRVTASRAALLAVMLRNTPTNDAKLHGVLQAFLIQIEHARRQGKVSEACATQLTNSANDILSQI